MSQDQKFKSYKLEDATYNQYPLLAAQKQLVVALMRRAASELNLFDLVKKESQNMSNTAATVLDALSGDILHEFMGIVLVKEGEKASALADVVDFAERGRRLMFLMGDNIEQEIVADFFVLNRAAIDQLLSVVGANLTDLQSKISTELGKPSEDKLNSSVTDGVSTPE